MTDISEKQTMEYFLQGAAKVKSAARQLASANQTHAWTAVRSQIGLMQKYAEKIFNDKPQTRLQTLSLADKIQKETKH